MNFNRRLFTARRSALEMAAKAEFAFGTGTTPQQVCAMVCIPYVSLLLLSTTLVCADALSSRTHLLTCVR